MPYMYPVVQQKLAELEKVLSQHYIVVPKHNYEVTMRLPDQRLHIKLLAFGLSL